VARALGLTRAHDGLDLVEGPLWLADLPPRRGGHRIACGSRIGIRVALDRDWRCFLEGHPCVSAPAGSAPREGGARLRPDPSRLRG
jgi:3-methyladenine DNA glycosylase Mpg